MVWYVFALLLTLKALSQSYKFDISIPTGNLVTCEYWDYVWLNEGFASYLEYIIADMV